MGKYLVKLVCVGHGIPTTVSVPADIKLSDFCEIVKTKLNLNNDFFEVFSNVECTDQYKISHDDDLRAVLEDNDGNTKTFHIDLGNTCDIEAAGDNLNSRIPSEVRIDCPSDSLCVTPDTRTVLGDHLKLKDGPCLKLALIIANGNYANLELLPAAINASRDIANCFLKFGFVAFSYMDLNKKEIERVIEMFCFVGKHCHPAYMCAYVFGHGFDDQTTSYLVPVDGPDLGSPDIIQKSIPMSYIQEQFDLCSPKLIFMKLDLCRHFIYNKSLVVPYKPKKPNTLIVYGTCPGRSSFEQNSRSFFASKLKEVFCLSPKLSIASFCDQLLSRGQDGSNEDDQFFELKQSLRNAGSLSLADKCCPFYLEGIYSILKGLKSLGCHFSTPSKFRLPYTNIQGLIGCAVFGDLGNILRIDFNFWPLDAVKRHKIKVSTTLNILDQKVFEEDETWLRGTFLVLIPMMSETFIDRNVVITYQAPSSSTRSKPTATVHPVPLGLPSCELFFDDFKIKLQLFQKNVTY